MTDLDGRVCVLIYLGAAVCVCIGREVVGGLGLAVATWALLTD